MDSLSHAFNFRQLCEKVCIGNLESEPQQVFGGLLHRMYRLQTKKGVYAVKVLNPQIMKRETAMRNYIFSEKVATIVFDNGINALPAISINGNSIHEVDGQYYLIFTWSNRKTLPQNKVDINKAKIISGVIAKIHRLDFSSISEDIKNDFTMNSIHWNDYAQKAKIQNIKWADMLLKNIDTLYESEKLSNKAMRLVSKNMVISHRDLDQKNVLWNLNDNPLIIDWEAAGFINPSVELLDVALYWSGGISDKKMFCTIIDCYIKNGGTVSDDIESVLLSGLKGKLEWLEYNIKRSLRIECSDDYEQEIGTSEVIKSIQLIQDYLKLIPILLKWL